MRPIHLAHVGGKARPVLILTREEVRPRLTNVTVAPITSRIRGLSTEVPAGPRNGLDEDSVVSCDNIVTIKAAELGRFIGIFHDDQELLLTEAIHAAFDLEGQ